MADSKLALIAAEDMGRTAFAVFRNPDVHIGRTVSVAGAHASGAELAALISDVIGETVHYRPFAWDQFRSLPFWTAVTAGNAFPYFAENERDLPARRDLDESRRLNHAMEPLDAWLRSHRAGLLLSAQSRNRPVNRRVVRSARSAW
ncbi:hypothetical protein CLM62_27530 [Streptomyces sp. SA15]|uniref:NmrA family NAD(P)-binding protein n=1 Tax=Streptomyces sp. SA15 TaxID=934019 RepID=UPI000BAFDD37|nr:NmrA family NAD(P)-binding protein [Streptomyces sp. SA15]PAZ12892.1 hypothetical protein CLM62_27530 [Streptomyces sp. SA15]